MIVFDHQRKKWDPPRNGDCTDEVAAISKTVFFLPLEVLSIRRMIKEILTCSGNSFAARNLFICVAKHFAVMTLNQTNSNLAAKY